MNLSALPDHTTPKPTSVYVVEDDEDVRLLVGQWIAASDRFVLVGEATTTGEALDDIRRLQPSVVVMDAGIPRGEGVEATRAIASISPRSRVLAHTGRADRRHILETIGAGVHGYLVKSGDRGEFLDALTVLAGGGTYLSPLAGVDVFDHIRSMADRRRLVAEALVPDALQIALQPIVQVQSGEVVGHEALARFPHESPAPVFEAAADVGRGLEVELIAAEAAIDIARRVDRHLGFVCVNVSPDTALTPSFRHLLEHADPERTVIELTENSAVHDYPRLRAVLDPLRARGFRIAVDDVGGGFSCLSHVHQLGPDLIKIDRYLVQDIDTDRIRRGIVAALTAIGGDADAVLVAEGVEREAELEVLAELGVELVQGFLLGRPELFTVRRVDRPGQPA